MALGFATAIIEIRALDLLSKPLTGMAGSMARFGMGMAQVGLALSAAITVPILAAGVAAAKTAIDFDKSMRNIQSISKDTDTEIQRLGDSFRALSKDLTKTVAAPNELAEAFYEIQSAAFYGAEAQKILEQSTKTATAGLANQIQTAKAVSVALHAYGVGAEEVTHFTDVMMRSVDVGVFRFEDLTTQMGDFIAAAGMMKLPIEEVFAALTTMTKRGIQASEAATSLNRILTTYLKPSAAAVAAAEKYGITLSATTLKTLGFAGALNQVYTATKGNEDALSAIFRDMRGVRGVFALASDGLEMFNDDVKILQKSAGTVDQVFSTQIRSWDAQFKNFRNTLQDLGISLGEKVLPIVMSLVNDGIRPLVQSLRDMPTEQLSRLVSTLATLSLVGPGLIIVGSLINAFAQIFSVVSKLLPLLGALGPVFTAIIGPALALAIPVGLIAVGIAMLVKQAQDYVSPAQRMAEATQGVADAMAEYNRQLQIYSQVSSEAQRFLIADLERARVAAVTAQAAQQQLERERELGIIRARLAQATWTLADAQTKLADAVRFGTKEDIAHALALVDSAQRAIDYWKAMEQSALFTQTATERVKSHTEALAKMAPVIGLVTVEQARLNDELERFKTTADFASEAFDKWYTFYRNTQERMFQEEYQGLVPPGADYEEMYRDASIIKGIVADLEAKQKASADARAKAEEAAANRAQKAWQSAKDKIVGGFEEMLKAGEKWLDKLTPDELKGVSDPLDPNNPNSPFQPFYRILDVALRRGPGKTPGVDTAKWAEMYFPGMSVEDQAAMAQAITDKIKAGKWLDQDVLRVLGEEGIAKLRALQQDQQLTQEMRTVFAEFLTGPLTGSEIQQAVIDAAKGNPLTAQIPAAIMGLGDPKTIQATQTTVTTKLNEIVNKSITEGGIQQAAIDAAKGNPLTAQIPAAIMGLGDPKTIQATQTTVTTKLNEIINKSIAEGGIQQAVIDAAKTSPLSTQIPVAILGFSDPKVVQGATDSMLGTLLPAIDKSITDNQENLANKGHRIWSALEAGIIGEATRSGALYRAVESMVAAALAAAVGP